MPAKPIYFIIYCGGKKLLRKKKQNFVSFVWQNGVYPNTQSQHYKVNTSAIPICIRFIQSVWTPSLPLNDFHHILFYQPTDEPKPEKKILSTFFQLGNLLSTLLLTLANKYIYIFGKRVFSLEPCLAFHWNINSPAARKIIFFLENV